MKKTKKRNELAIFEEFRLKPPSNLREAPKKSDLKNIDIFKYYNHKLKKDTYWIIAKSGYILQVDKSGRLILSSHNDYQKNTPVKSYLKKSHQINTRETFKESQYLIKNKEISLIRINLLIRLLKAHYSLF